MINTTITTFINTINTHSTNDIYISIHTSHRVQHEMILINKVRQHTYIELISFMKKIYTPGEKRFWHFYNMRGRDGSKIHAKVKNTTYKKHMCIMY